jgi:hypothetical protein
MLRSIDLTVKRSYSETILQRSGLTAALAAVMCGCALQPHIATSFWRIGTPADSIRPGYTVIHAEGKTRHCYPITEWTADPAIDTYHQLHHHGVAVESELMAYRIYFDRKQTIDPYCKRTPQLELATSHWYPKDSLLAAGYGDDILRVSGTVGVGSVKYWNGKKHVHIEPVAERSQRIVSQSRNKATIEVAVKDWQVEGKSVNMATRYTMHAGHRDMRCDVLLSDSLAGLCTGVQTIPAKGANQKSKILNLKLQNGVLLASFGTDWPVNDSAKYVKETVGLGVFIPKKYAGEIVQDKQNLLCLLKSTDPHFYLTCVGATKENHPVATTAEEWFNYLRRWAKTLK